MFVAHRPSSREIARFIDESRALPLSYGPVGVAATGAAGFRLDEQTVTIGAGAGAYERAAAALAAWRHFELGWVDVYPKAAPTTDGTIVAVAIRHFGFWSLNGCRVVYQTGEGRPVGGAMPKRFGFAYGTLPNHAESGEEVFEVRFEPETGAVTYRIRAASRPRALLARAGFPLTRLLQARFRRDSALALQRATGR